MNVALVHNTGTVILVMK